MDNAARCPQADSFTTAMPMTSKGRDRAADRAARLRLKWIGAYRVLHERGRDRLAASPAGGVVDQRRFVALEVAQQVSDMPPQLVHAGHVALGLVLRPAAQGRKLASAPRPAPMP